MPIGIYKHKKGFHLSKKWKQKISKALKGRISTMKGKHHSKETKRKMSEIRKGIKFSKNTLRKMSISKKLRFSNPEIRKKLSETIKKLYQNNPLYKQKLRIANLGKKASLETRQKMSLATRLKNHWNWQGGKSFEPYTVEWKNTLKRSIRERDKYVCQICSIQQNDIAFDVHHIDYDKKNCNPNNLITLCHSCHTKTGKNRNYWMNILQKGE